MLTYKSMRLDCMGFRNVVVPLDKVGTTIIKGRNLNASLSGRANGAGKTLLVQPIQHFKYNTKQKSLFTSGNSIELDVEVNGVPYQLIKSMPKSSVKYDIIKNGVNVEARTSSIAEDLIADLLPQTEEEFYTFTYLDSRRPNDLQFGTPTARLNFFSNIFRLHDFDIVRQEISDRIKALSHKSAELKVLESQLSEIQLANIDVVKLRRKVVKAKKSIDAALDWAKEKALQDSYRETIKKYQKYEHLNGREKEGTRAIANYEEILRHNSVAESHNEMLEEVLRKYKVWVKWESYLQKTFNSTLTGKQLQKHCDDIQRKTYQEVEENNRLVERCKQLKEDRRKASKIKVAEYKDPSVLQAKIETARSTLKDLLKSDGKKICNYCGSRINAKHLKKHIADLRESIIGCTKQLAVSLDMARLQKQRDDLWNTSKQKELKNLKGVKPRSMKVIDIYKYEAITKVPTRMKHKAVPNIDDYKGLATWIPIKKTYLKAKANIKDIGKQPNVNRANKIIEKYGRILADYDLNIKRHKTLTTQVKTLSKELRDLPLYEALLLAYSNKGIKLNVMKQLAARIEANMNEYAPLLFPEKFKFEINVELNKFDILATRSKRTSDIRFLSGAESRAFSLLFMISCLPLVPKHRRANIIVLDEFEAGLDKPTRDLMINKFLPALNKIVPHIIFITPNDIQADKSVNRDVLTVVKSKDVTYIEDV